MKKLIKVLGFVLVFALLFTSLSCKQKDSEQTDWREQQTNCKITPTKYSDLIELTGEQEISQYNKESKTNFNVANGVVKSPYYSLKINGKTVPVYGTRTANGLHSFAYVTVEKTSSDFALNTELEFLPLSTVRSYGAFSVTVLPESKKVKATLREEKITCVIRDFGSFSFVYNKFHGEALTLIVAQKVDTEELFGDFNVEYIYPDDYSTAKMREYTDFKNSNTVYYFKDGRYKIDRISMPSDSILYFEQGAYLEVVPSEVERTNSVFSVYGKSNVKVIGGALFDMSACCGSVPENAEGLYNNKGGFGFTCCNDVTVSGLTFINSQTWTLCMTDVEDVYISDCLFYGYRTFADGVMLSDCKNAIVENSFVRTGDDGFETKSTSASGYTDNVLFRNNAAWTDGAVAYGCIYEANHDTRNVRFENCSVGFALGTWSTHLGSCVIQLGNRKDAVTENIVFDGFEVYTSYNPAVCSIYTGGSGGAGIGWGQVDNIRFRNISVKYNNGAVLSLRTYDEDSSIKNVYIDNFINEGKLITKEDLTLFGYLRCEVKGGYDIDKYLHVNTEIEN